MQRIPNLGERWATHILDRMGFFTARRTSGRGGFGLAFGVLLLGQIGFAAQFEVGAILRAGAAGSSDWEIGAGDTSGSAAATADNNPYWANLTPQNFDISYNGSTNTLQVTLFRSGSATLSNQASYQPASGPVPAGATWTIPAASFFLQALNGPTALTAIAVTNLSLSGISSALTVLQPMQQTILVATNGLPGYSLVTQSQDVVFQSDSTGSWQLRGAITMLGVGGVGGASGSQLALGITAFSATPEPGAALLSFVGLAAIALVKFRKLRNAKSQNTGGS